MGRSALVTLLVTVILILAAISFLTFLWYSNFNNHIWHLIMVRGWATRAISITALVLRTSVDLQACIAAAMLAALKLEYGGVLLKHAPSSRLQGPTGPHRVRFSVQCSQGTLAQADFVASAFPQAYCCCAVRYTCCNSAPLSCYRT